MPRLRWRLKEWTADGCRHVELWMNLRVMPYVRQTQKTRFRKDKRGQRAQEYNDAQATIRESVEHMMKQEGLKKFPERRLGFAASFWLKPKRVWAGRRHATVDDPEALDLGNLEKALEDALQGSLMPNDKYIWHRGEGEKYEGEDAFLVHVWELPA